MGKVDKDVVRIAAEAGAKAALERWEKEKEKAVAEKKDRRLHNTRILLQNYRRFREHAANAVFEVGQLDESVFDILDLMQRHESNMFVDSIKKSVARTVMLVDHIDTMLGLYRVYCENSSKPEDARRWRVIHGKYIAEHEKTVLDLAEQENVADRTIRRDIEEACEHLAALFFGIDGIRKE